MINKDIVFEKIFNQFEPDLRLLTAQVDGFDYSSSEESNDENQI